MSDVVARWPELPSFLQRWDDGSIRVGGTRLMLDTVVTAFTLGDSPEEIASNHGREPLSLIYKVLAYYLENRDGVDSYVQEGLDAAEALCIEAEQRLPSAAFREKILSRVKAMSDAPGPR